MLGRVGASSSPPSANTTCSRSEGVATITNTTSHSPSSTIDDAARAPSFTRCSILEGVRFHAVTSTPASTSRRAIANPIRPVPSQPTVGLEAMFFLSNCQSIDYTGAYSPKGVTSTGA